MQENRSFDHYFGSRPGVRGFSDPVGRHGLPAARLPGGTAGVLEPWRLDLARPGHDCTPDITHEWGPQHRSWNGGAMDRFVPSTSPRTAPQRFADHGVLRPRADLGFYHALADAFTLCDAYHCSVLGPTDPNRLYAMSATLDPTGARRPAGAHPDRGRAAAAGA